MTARDSAGTPGIGEAGRAPEGGGVSWAGHRLALRALCLSPRLARALTLSWLVLIFLLSEMRGRPGAGTPFWSLAFNLGHAVLYGALAVLALLGLPDASGAVLSTGARRAVVAAVGLCGLLDEFHQRFVPGRDFSLLDLGTDLVGAAGALLVLERLVRIGREDRRAGLWGACLVAILAAVSAAAVATFLPDFLPRYDWL